MMKSIEGNIVDVHNREIFKGSVEVENGRIVAINRHSTTSNSYILPGFVDAHVHIESSMLTPENFGYLTVQQGTVAVVTDPHEIAGVIGVTGVEFMIENSRKSPIKTFFTIPSCVPATDFDSAGGIITSDDVEKMASTGQYVGLSEMMNVPGVLGCDNEVMAKLAIPKKYHLPIDGHAPMLQDRDLTVYANNGISTDHECTTLAEALQKIELGMKVIIREGSAARNYEVLKTLIKTHPKEVMFCSDDAHPDEIMNGHIRRMVSRSISNRYDLFDILKIASINPINHYKLDVGQLRVGDRADFIVVDSLETFNVQQVYIDGNEQIGRGQTRSQVAQINNFNHEKIDLASLKKGVSGTIKVISIINGEILTKVEKYSPQSATENLESDVKNDIAKIVYINRYQNSAPQVAFCKGFNLKEGAFASFISHDSHNIVAVGATDAQLMEAINAVIENSGALAVNSNGKTEVLPLPIAGIMSDRSGQEVATDYCKLGETVKQMGCTLDSPFMTLSFLSLLVIPELRIGEKGLFDCADFNWTNQKYRVL